MSVSIQDFGKSTSGQTVKLATLKNDYIEVQLLSYAAIIHRIIVKDRKGNPVDVVLGYDTAADYELNTDSMAPPWAALPTALRAHSSRCMRKSSISRRTRTETVCTAACTGSITRCLTWR